MTTTNFDEWLSSDGPRSPDELISLLDAVEIGGDCGSYVGTHASQDRVFVKRRRSKVTLALLSLSARRFFTSLLDKQYLARSHGPKKP
jgi:hypothetical protein